MNVPTYIFIGRSGSGKGTQAQLVMEEIKKREPELEVLYLQTGALIREFITHDNDTARRAKIIYDKGDRQPDFIAVNMWSNFFIKNIKEDGTQALVADGTPRSLAEAQMLDTALSWLYCIPMPTVVYMNVSNEWSTERMLSRGRSDDNRDDIKDRLQWFKDDVMPAVQWYRANPNYRFLDIAGERSIEDVAQDIARKIFS